MATATNRENERAALQAHLASNPGDYQSHCRLGLEYQNAGRLEAARLCYEAALRVAPPSPELSHNLGAVCLRLGDLPRAREHLEQALKLRPESLATLDELAIALQDSDDIDGALACYEKCLQIDPRHHQAFAGMGLAFSDAGWEEDAIRSFETALSIEPDQLEAINGLGVLFKRQGRYDEAMALFERALALSPDDLGLLRNQAMLLASLGRLEEAEAGFRQIIAADPDDADAHFSLASLLLLTGRLPEGFKEYESRWSSRQSESVKPPPTKLPRWWGEPVSPESHGLIVYAEQGFGDCIQFSRFVPLAAKHFGKVRLHTRKALFTLFQRSYGACAEVVTEVTDEAGFTHHCPVMSLPLAFGTALATIPASVPYLVPDAEKARKWRDRLAGETRLKVGVAWASGKRGLHKRSFDLTLQMLEPLFRSVDVRWVSLNKVPLDAVQITQLERCGVTDWTEELRDFDDTAALVDALDLVLTVDTAMVHLAGALNKSAWLLNRAESEWRWLMERTDSPWYPSVRIFRQSQSRQWEPVFDAVAEALRMEASRIA